MNTSHLIILLLSIFIKTNGEEGKEACGEKDVCWHLQDETSKMEIDASCQIEIITEETESVDNQDTTSATTTPSSTVLVIDPCMNEENRSFMECVLDYNPTITETDEGYNKGKCQCYRNWSQTDFRRPAYNHSLNYEKDSKAWFTYSEEHKECVVKARERCAPAVPVAVPYRCETIKEGEHELEGRCFQIGHLDPHYRICTNGKGKDGVGEAITILSLVISTYFSG